MPKMSAVHAHSLSIGQASNVIPVHFIVSKARPTVRLGLSNKFLPAAVVDSREKEEALSRHGVEELESAFGPVGPVDLQKVSREPISAVFCVVAIERTNLVGDFSIATPTKLDLHCLGLVPCAFCDMMLSSTKTGSGPSAA